MPANKKYLMQSGWAKASKVIAAILGGLLASIALHMVLAIWIDQKIMLTITLFTMFIVWPLMMVMVYWIRKPWVSWAVLMSITLVCSVGIYIGKYL